MQILGDVVAAVAGADDDGVLAGPLIGIVVGMGVHDGAGELIETRYLRDVGNAADARRHDDVPGAHLAPGAVRQCQLRAPALRGIVVGSAGEFRCGPVVELHRLDIELEPVGELVLRDIGGPVRWERHVG